MSSAANELVGMESSKRSVAERLGSLSWQATVGSMAAFGGFAGAWGEHDSASVTTMVVKAFISALAAGGFTLVLVVNLYWSLRNLPSSDRRIVIDAARLGQSITEGRLADPLLCFVAKKRKKLSRSTMIANVVTLLLGAGVCVFGAVLTARVGEVLDTAVLCVLGAACLFLAGIWPAAVAAARRNIDAAEQSALALRSAFEASAPVREGV